ncbi:MAG: DUF5329 family protein [Thermoanaerobaculia bacterium]
MRRFAGAALLVALAASASGAADASSRSRSEQAKIDALLSQMKGSDAVFVRNGKEYTGRKAASHLKRKLAFAGSRVRTARDFIAGIATRSEETGEPYRVRFRTGEVRPLSEWLEERLAASRRKGRSSRS